MIAIRQLASNIILSLNKNAPIQETLSAFLNKYPLNELDRGLCSDLVYGYLRSKLRLEYILNKFLRNPQKLPLQMRILLALAVYSLLFQSKIPAYAILDQTVGIIKKIFGKGLAQVANGVLRSILRSKEEINQQEWYLNKQNKWQGLCDYWSMPETIANIWLKAYGEETTLRLMRRSFERPWTGIRVNARHILADELLKQFSCHNDKVEAISSYGFALPPGQIPACLQDNLTKWHKIGALSYQSAGSQLVLEKLGIYDWEETVWDCCAGVGGKTQALLERGIKVYLASDISQKRIKHIPEFCGRLGLKEPEILLADASQPPLKKSHGNILVDVPCSGLGVLSRRPDIRYNFSGWQGFANKQRVILKNMTSLLKSGHRLAYITCTLNPGENENVVEEILNQDKNLRLLEQWQTSRNHPWLEGMFVVVISKK